MTIIDQSRRHIVEWEDSKSCPNCGSTDIRHDRDRCETYCNHCGQVISNQPIEHGRQYKRSRTVE